MQHLDKRSVVNRFQNFVFLPASKTGGCAMAHAALL